MNANCTRPHWYIVEVIGQAARYAGSDQAAATDAVAGIDIDSGEEGYVVAEHLDDGAYCPRESNRIECTAIAAGALA